MNDKKKYIIASAEIPDEVKIKLSRYGHLIIFKTSGITYPSVSCHPDIFMCQINDMLVVAPNLPEEYFDLFRINKIPFILGDRPVGHEYPFTATYNAVITSNYLIHHSDITDSMILDISKTKKIIHVNQGYCRCNLLSLNEKSFITSDKGIFSALKKNKMNVDYFDPQTIILSGQKHGFLGGCCGVYDNNLFVIGSLKYYAEGDKLKLCLSKINFNIIELYDGPLIDKGSIFFL